MSPRTSTVRPSTRARSMPAQSVPTITEPTPEMIRMRAYEIYMARGNKPGSPESDWYQAETELRARIALLGKA